MEGKKPCCSWRVLEFYSGIGGMRYSLMRAGIDAEVVEAFDINDTANDVYQHNFAHRPSQGNIQSLSSFELDKFGADAWLLSPPCQPYTRQGLQKHSADARASSFISIIKLLPHMLHPPIMLFVENVVGFETSDTHMQLKNILVETNFTMQEYILSPLQFGIPYSRPRYFCLAKRKPWSFKNQSFDGQLLSTPDFLLTHGNTKLADRICPTADEVQPIKKFLQGSISDYNHPEKRESNISLEQITEQPAKNKTVISLLDEYCVPLGLIERWGSAMDIVFSDSKRCCCFTKSYYRYVKGTGSLLATVQTTERSDICSLKELYLRYFTPREVANLHSFPEEFNFPSHISLRQRYALLGNSLSVAVVAPLLQYLFSGDMHCC